MMGKFTWQLRMMEHWNDIMFMLFISTTVVFWIWKLIDIEHEVLDISSFVLKEYL